jgi:hypothetical protein
MLMLLDEAGSIARTAEKGKVDTSAQRGGMWLRALNLRAAG